MIGAWVLAFVCGTASGWGADSLGNCEVEDQSHPQSIVKAKLYRAFCGGTGMPVLLDSLPAAAGIETCFTVDTTCVTYWMTAVNGAGMESICKAAISFPRVVGVHDPPPGPVRDWSAYLYDLTGRRVRLPVSELPDGVYFSRGLEGRRLRLIVRNGRAIFSAR